MRIPAIAGLVLLTLATACGREGSIAPQLTEASESPTPPTTLRPTATPTLAPTPSPSPSPVGWKRVDEETFSMEVPADMVERDVQGIDSQVGEYRSDRLFLGYDYGWYGSDCTKEPGQERHGEVKQIDGREAKMIFIRSADPRAEHPYWACVFFPDVNRRLDAPTPTPSASPQHTMATSLVLSVSAPDREAWTAGRRIFESIRFAR
jgi:hypothetical protein